MDLFKSYFLLKFLKSFTPGKRKYTGKSIVNTADPIKFKYVRTVIIQNIKMTVIVAKLKNCLH